MAIGNIDQVDSHPNDQLLILCKDARIIRWAYFRNICILVPFDKIRLNIAII